MKCVYTKIVDCDHDLDHKKDTRPYCLNCILARIGLEISLLRISQS